MLIFALSLPIAIIIIVVVSNMSASWVIKFQGLKLAILLTEALKFVSPIRVHSCYNCPFSVLLIYCFVVYLAAPF
jgi:phosphatidylserine synthase